MENEERRIEVRLKDNRLIVEDQSEIEGLSTRGYGVPDNNKLVLTPYEGLYLLSKEIIEVIDDESGERLDFKRLLNLYHSLDESTWVRYLIYRDLRSRGYVVREGFGLGIDFRVYERGSYGKKVASYLVFGILEGKPVKVEELNRTLNYAQNLKKKLILAVINRRGEVVYYSLSKLTFLKGEEKNG